MNTRWQAFRRALLSCKTAPPTFCFLTGTRSLRVYGDTTIHPGMTDRMGSARRRRARALAAASN